MISLSLNPVYGKFDLFDKRMRYNVAQYVYQTPIATTTWMERAQSKYKYHKDVWKKIYEEKTPFALVTILTIDVNILHYIFYEFFRFGLLNIYDVICISSTIPVIAKKLFPGQKISIPLKLENVLAYCVTLNGVNKIANCETENILDVPDLKIFTFHV